MLRLLEVQNLALIDNLAFYPAEGLNVLSGETGAGKSMLLSAVSLLLGERATADVIRSGEDAALMQAVFSNVPHAPASEDETGEMLFTREVRKNGPNICRINGRVETLAQISAVGRKLVDLHGQNRQQSLLEPAAQRDLLDAYGGEKIAGLRYEYSRCYRSCCELQKALDAMGGDEASAARQADFLRFQLNEIEAAALNTEEENELAKRFRRLSNARQLLERTAKIYGDLYEGSHESALADRLGVVEKELAGAAALDETLSDILAQVAAAAAQLREAARELRGYQDNIHLDEAELSEVITRLETYKKLKKKYGPAVEDVQSLAESLRTELAELEGRSVKRNQAAAELVETEKQLKSVAARLSQARQETAQILADRIQGALQYLALGDARFAVAVKEEAVFGPCGRDSIAFEFSANAGEPLRPLAKTASGGEISRVMLAIKSVLAEQDTVPTLIFDEIDAGIGGLTVRAVAERLKQLARHRQVICVTHQPLIAAAADHHFVIFKETAAGRTSTRLKKLKEEERAHELARMLGGEEGAALAHAKELLQGKN